MKQFSWPAGDAVHIYDRKQFKVRKQKLVVHKVESWNIFNPLSTKFENLPCVFCEIDWEQQERDRQNEIQGRINPDTCVHQWESHSLYDMQAICIKCGAHEE